MSLKKNLDVKVFEQLREKIIRGEWEPGQALSADELSDYYGVSKTPVLLALKRMEALNMLTVTSTGHYFVPEYTERDVYDLLEMRALLERQAIFDLETRGITPDFDRLSVLVQECDRANADKDVVSARKADMAFHSTLVSSVGNPYLSDLYDRVQSQFMVANYLITGHTQAEQKIAADEHVTILDELRKGDFATTRAAMDAHIYAARDKMLDKIKAKASSKTE